MVGLSILLESTSQKGIMMIRNSQVINKSTIIKNPPVGFLDYCSLCCRKLLPANDIYMYKGDRAFCSEECRCRQIFMDEEEGDGDIVCRSHLKENCGFSAPVTAGAATSSSSSGVGSGSGKRRRNRSRGGANGAG